LQKLLGIVNNFFESVFLVFTQRKYALLFIAYAVGRVFVDSYFTAIAKNDVTSMVDQLLNAFKKLVKELQWMDEATKTRALEKAENMWKNIGYPDFIKDNALLDKYYNLLSPEIKENEPFYRVNSVVQEWMMSLQMNDLTKPFNRKSFGGSPAIVNAWYSNLKNSITFPAGILQFPFFDATYPKAVNYGAIGSVIGHEITHGFDDQGSQYNASGDLQNWWSESSALHFDKKTQCMKEQYDHYCYPQLNKCVQGDTTLGENIADNGGLKEAFTAYQTYVAEHGEELRLPSLAEYSMDQIFFISFASFWCGSYKDNFLRNLLSTNEHAPNEFRVKGVVQNSKEFAEAFNCPLGSPMNPEHKCTVW
uniref:Neprilysin n=1 Tax=Soboliphyme baturini TaxID=241478 RepID=A0A183ICI0_9BILA